MTDSSPWTQFSFSSFGFSNRPWTATLVGLAGLVILAWGIAILPISAVMLAGMAGAGLVLLVRWPWIAWLVLAAGLPVASSIRWGPISAADMVLVGAMGLWFADGVRRRRLELAFTGPALFLALYLASLLLALPAAADLGEGAQEVIKWVQVLLVFLLVGQSLTARRRRWLATALLAAATGQALLGLYQFLFQVGPDFFIIFGRFMRASGSFRQPNPFAGYLGLSLPVAISLALWALGQTRVAFALNGSNREAAGRRPLLWFLLYGGCAVVIALGLVASWSRGGWLGAASGLAVVLGLRNRWTVAFSALVLLFGLGLGVTGGLNLDPLTSAAMGSRPIEEPGWQRMADLPAYFNLADVMEQPLTDDNFSVQERVAHWIAALRMWERSPWLGIGLGNYALIYPAVRLPAWEEPLGHAHNIYLNVLAETGMVGLATYLLLGCGVVAWIWRRYRAAAAHSWNAALALGVLGVVAHFSVHNFFDNLLVQGMYLHLALWLALLVEPAAVRPELNRSGSTSLRKSGGAHP
jgi:putative inorganic carbon (hco3(-)) transporter